MAKGKLASSIKHCKHYIASYDMSKFSVYVFNILSLGHILIRDLVVASLFMYSLPSMVLFYLAIPCFIPKIILHEI